MKIFPTYFFLLFLSLSSVQALVFATFSLTSLIQDALARHWPRTSVVPPNFDFWRSAKDLGDKANIYKEKILREAAADYAPIAYKINEFQETMNRVVTSAEAMAPLILQHVDLEEFQNRLVAELSRGLEGLKEELSEPLPENQTERYHQQAIRFARALDIAEDELVNVCGFWKIPEADVRMKFGDIKPHLNHGLLITANLVNNHPVLFETLLFSAVIIIIPQGLILRPILTLFGFGPSGPIKGSFAAFAQRFFFGAAVKEGSWFSMLQRAGMKTYEAGLLTKFSRAIKCFFWGSC